MADRVIIVALLDGIGVTPECSHQMVCSNNEI